MSAGTASGPPVVLTIAGFDPTTGAGVGADLKTIAAHGCYGVAAVTAVTVQSTKQVFAVEAIPADVLQRQLDQLLSDIPIAAVKIGMLATRAHVEVTIAVLEERELSNVVLDPVLRSTSGTSLLDPGGVEELRARLLPLADVITPNLWEARVLAGLEIQDKAGIREAARRLKEMGVGAVVLTGGDLEQPVDYFYDGDQFTEFTGEKVRSENTHGTGCAFSSAIAANLAQGKEIADALVLAKSYVAEAIKKGYALGEGKGFLNHQVGSQS